VKADRSALVFLFTTGLVSMGMEVVWVRQFTPYLGTVVYAFAAILSIYLLATFAGTQLYRWRTGGQGPRVTGLAWTVACVSAFLPLLTADYRWGTGPGMLSAAVRVALGIVPFCACLGFLTPMLVDRWSGGQPRQAGFAYAVNIIGSLLGPLLAGFLLLPLLGERWSLVALALPLFLIAGWNRILRAPQAASARTSWAPAAAAGLASLSLVLFTRDYAWLFPDRVTLRDSTATVVATGDGMEKQLLVNGYGMTSLTPITKMMAHLPAVHLSESPRKSLALCFGMGTSFRSLVSWGGQVTAVELCPSVPKLFGFYHADAADVVKQPGAQIIVDDARRFLERTPERYDLITIDPPPPLEAAASSLLYSTEFYKLVIDRMSPEGIFQQWNPGGEPAIQLAVARTVALSFPHVRAFKSMEGWGVHYLASLKPIPALSAEDAAGRLPAKAASDLVEWGPTSSAATQFALVLERELDLAPVLQRADLPTIEDDRPFNEYYVLRRWRGFRSGNR
jgi:predicted membrane-bound spermidine synthase